MAWLRLAQGSACAYVGQNPILRPDGFWAEGAFEPAQNLSGSNRRFGWTPPAALATAKTSAQSMAGPGLASTDQDELLRFVLESAERFFQRVGAAPNYFLSEATWQALAASERVEFLGALVRPG